MTPLRQQLGDIDWKEAGSFLAFLAGLGAILRWLFLPFLRSAARSLLSDEITKLTKAAEEVSRCAEGLRALGDELAEIHELAEDGYEVACANREWMTETHHLLDVAWKIDRRNPEGERRNLPELPRLPERRRRPRRRED